MIERPGTRWRRDPAPMRSFRRRAWGTASLITAALICSSIPAAAAPAAPQPPMSHPATVDDSMRALARLHDFGYSIDTQARADRAVRHWQRVNGLTVDGVIGSRTLASLGLARGATASVPAVRATPPPEPVAATDVESIIRQAWPDELEDRALAIAHRESRLVPTARNACCLGLFQINWPAHRSWLADLGITTSAQLLDAGTNAAAAFALYQRDGWHPWAL